MRSTWILLLLLAGCRSAVAPAPPPSFSQRPPDEVPPQLHIERVSAFMGSEAVTITAVVNYPGYGEWAAQVFLDTDNDAATGRDGRERIARLVERDANDVFPVRSASGVGGPGSGGWGPVMGYGSFVREGVSLHVVLPYDALGDNNGLAYRFEVYGPEPLNAYDFKDGTATPPDSGFTARRKTTRMR